MLEGYNNMNSMKDEIKFTSGNIFTLDGGGVSWKSSKQMCLAHFTMESELVALDKVYIEIEWLRNLITDIYPYISA